MGWGWTFPDSELRVHVSTHNGISMLTSSNMFTNRIRSGVLLNIQRVSANAGWFTYRSLRGATRDDCNPPHDTFATEIRSQALRMSLYEWFLENISSASGHFLLSSPVLYWERAAVVSCQARILKALWNRYSLIPKRENWLGWAFPKANLAFRKQIPGVDQIVFAIR